MHLLAKIVLYSSKCTEKQRLKKFQLNLAVQKLNLPLTNTAGSTNDAFDIHTDPTVYGGVDFSFFRTFPEGVGRI